MIAWTECCLKRKSRGVASFNGFSSCLLPFTRFSAVDESLLISYKRRKLSRATAKWIMYSLLFDDNVVVPKFTKAANSAPLGGRSSWKTPNMCQVEEVQSKVVAPP